MPLRDEKDVESGLVSKNILIEGRRTSVRLEPEMWVALKDIAAREKSTIHELCTLVFFCKRSKSTLTAAIRVFLMLYYKSATTEEGHEIAGHGDIMHMKERIRMHHRGYLGAANDQKVVG